MRNSYLFAFVALFTLSSNELYGGHHITENNEEKPRASSFKTVGKKDAKESAAQRRTSCKLRFARVNKETPVPQPYVSRNFQDDSIVAPEFFQELDTIEANYYAQKSDDQKFLQELAAVESEHSSSRKRDAVGVAEEDDDQKFLQALAEVEAEHSSQQSKRSAVAPKQDEDSSASSSESSHSKSAATQEQHHGFVTHLNTYDDHQNYLLDAIGKAHKKILITSYNFSASLENNSKLFFALQKASKRGAKIYLYFDHASLSEDEIGFFKSFPCSPLLNQVNIHSKLLSVDGCILAAGSFDWLGKPYFQQREMNDSIALEGEEVKHFIDEVWSTIRSYRALCENPHKTTVIDQRLEKLPSHVLKLEGNDEIELITTPQQHRGFFDEAFELDTHRLVICAPFITGDAHFLEDIFPNDTVRRFLSHGRQLQIFYRADDPKVELLRQHLAEFLDLSNLDLTPVLDLHQKVLIVGNKYVTGSFNWLSSADTVEDEWNFMETSMAFSGAQALRMIANFQMKFPQLTDKKPKHQKKYRPRQKDKTAKR
jgi:phosphatidylserine/phosphatidylglycerophosphate/cardiolipin synthase-like enzyme